MFRIVQFNPDGSVFIGDQEFHILWDCLVTLYHNISADLVGVACLSTDVLTQMGIFGI